MANASKTKENLFNARADHRMLSAELRPGCDWIQHDWNLDLLSEDVHPALHSEWRFNAPALDRIAHLNGTMAGGLNGNFRLDETTVFVENQVDIVTNFGTTSPLLDDFSDAGLP